MPDYPVICADSHLNEPHEIYQRLPEKFRHRAPRIEERDGGRCYLVVQGRWPFPIEIERTFARVAEDEKRKMLLDNTARFYGFPTG